MQEEQKCETCKHLTRKAYEDICYILSSDAFEDDRNQLAKAEDYESYMADFVIKDKDKFCCALYEKQEL